jgi:hypothetical protein
VRANLHVFQARFWSAFKAGGKGDTLAQISLYLPKK